MVSEKSGNNFSVRKASFKMIDVDTLRVSDACWNCSFGRWFVFLFIIRQANSRPVKIVQRSVKSQGTF